MSAATPAVSFSSPAASPDAVLALCREAGEGLQRYLARARSAVRRQLVKDGKLDAALLTRRQWTAHAFAWSAACITALQQSLRWAETLRQRRSFTELEALLLQIAWGAYLAQLRGGLMMSQQEFARPRDLGLEDDPPELRSPAAQKLLDGASPEALAALAGGLREGRRPALGDDDETAMVRDQFRRFADEKIAPHAQQWHLKDELIPMALIGEMSALGAFAVAIPADYGGLGMGRTAMCVITEELSRGFLAAGSLGTRADIAAELIRLGGNEQQKKHWLPKIAAGETLPTAVFTEPNHGSDLAALTTRAKPGRDGYVITGAKTWITHGARSDLMTLLARTDPQQKGWRGLSMFLLEKPRGDDDNPFPAEGMSGGEIEVLGYRGMKEYEIAFDSFPAPPDSLLGGVEGQGFKQLMATFESARIQTAARAVGVAQSALDCALAYAMERSQFGQPIIAFPRIAAKLAMMATETMLARQLTLYAASEKDSGRRCDVEAGMAKLLAARIAWANADNAVQIHGGNGYALEYPVSRILCDARILSVFEGAAEIQAQVVARGLLADER